MNDPNFFVIVVWRTRNSKGQTRAENLCKDYNLSRLQPSLYVGRLSKRERKELEKSLKVLLIWKRDQMHLLTSCRSCSLQSQIPDIIKKYYDPVSYEIV